ncbi:ABC transporter ATP-binding protein [Paenibacillus eucommiae]|uniref:ABC-type multidrug transport system fused ATPase/permease subunit n=1 Tax=Paenibacillus eucommiae TaxID=1355755 RepID=A0ABS4IQY7_9BACL|nr:ABC transporter ATP-binding protein [Paenibacillus eucommiae]MBP1989560.1 ABC-type multidrug transport system fused ATPase/permease subunit [Paenibacillus eucommiae]
MESEKRKHTYGFISNLIFMIRELWNFEKKGVFVPFIRIPSDIAVSFLGIWIPKIVLDAIEHSVPVYEFVMQLSLLTIAMMVLMYVSYYMEQSIFMGSVRIWNLHFYIKKSWKIVDMDYPHFASPAGKTNIERSHQALSRNINVNMVSFYPHFIELMKNIFGFFSYCTILIMLNPVIILLLILSYVINVLLVLNIEKWQHHTKDERAKMDRQLDYVVSRTSDSSIAKDIRMYNMKTWINSMSEFFMEEQYNWQKKIASKRFMQVLFEALLLFVRNGGAYIFLIWKMLNNEISIGEFVLYFGAITGFGQWLEQIVSRIGRLSTANYKVYDYRYFIDTMDKMRRDEGASLPPVSEPVEVVLENVSFSYEGSNELILDHINLKIRKGEKLAVVGTNGAGKTTLVKLICGLLEPVSGRVLMNGIDIKEFNRDEYYSLITAVYQNVCLLPVSIAKNITFCSDSDIDWKKLNKCTELADIKGKIESFPNGFDTNLVPSVTDHGVELSGGENQKLMLARALYKDAPLIILDEPTAALDPIAENHMYLKYDELTENKTAIFISHRLSSTRFCDRIILINDKQIAETGTHDELMALSGKYKEIFDIQSQYYKNSVGEEAI